MKTHEPRKSEKQSAPETGKVKKEYPHDRPVPEIIGDPHSHGESHPSDRSNGSSSNQTPSGGHKSGNNYNIQG